MCEHCQGADEDEDIEALAKAFLARHGKPGARDSAPAKPQGHALLNRRAPAPAGKSS